jgi:hypothetical protein
VAAWLGAVISALGRVVAMCSAAIKIPDGGEAECAVLTASNVSPRPVSSAPAIQFSGRRFAAC